MCLYTKQRFPRIAVKDIPVYKVINNDNTALQFSQMQYERGRTYRTFMKPLCISPSIDGYFKIHWGFHSCATKEACRFYDNGDLFSTKRVHMIIPKGALYYTYRDLLGNAVEYASNRICTGSLEAIHE